MVFHSLWQFAKKEAQRLRGKLCGQAARGRAENPDEGISRKLDLPPCKHPRSYVDPTENLSRFIYDKTKVNSKRVHHSAFEPDKQNELSVFRTNNRPLNYIWDLCDKFGREGVKPAVGRAEIKADVIGAHGLSFDPDGKGHTRHVNIVGWKDKTEDLQRRQLLALASKPCMRPN